MMFHIFITITSKYDEDYQNNVLKYTQKAVVRHNNPDYSALHGRGSNSQKYEQRTN